jgi:hypothetical protein
MLLLAAQAGLASAATQRLECQAQDAAAAMWHLQQLLQHPTEHSVLQECQLLLHHQQLDLLLLQLT